MKHITRLLAWLTPALIFVFLSFSPANAFFVQSGETLVISKETKIDEIAFLAGTNLTINADINGDLFCAGQDVTINGNVKGDIICASQNLKINGNVDGNIRAIGQTIEVFGTTTRNLSVASQKLVLGSKSQIKGDVIFGTQSLSLDGIVGRDLAGAGESILITGSLLRNATVTGTNFTMSESGRVTGNLDYYMEQEGTASLVEKNIKGVVTRHNLAPRPNPEMKKTAVEATGTALVLKIIYGIISYALLGLVLVYFDRTNTLQRVSRITKKPLLTGLIGVAVFFTAPAVFFILLVTVIGIPLAFVILFLYIIALVISSLYASAAYGKLFLTKLLRKEKTTLAVQMVVGVAVLGLLGIVPVLGWILIIVSFYLGLGAFFVTLIPEKS